MAHPEFEKAQAKAEMIAELTRVVSDQVNGHMDWVRARAYWTSRLPMLDTDLLAEALAEVLCGTRTPAKRYAPRHEC